MFYSHIVIIICMYPYTTIGIGLELKRNIFNLGYGIKF